MRSLRPNRDKALESVPGVQSARVDLAAKRATVDRTDPSVKYASLKQAILDAGYSVPDSTDDLLERRDEHKPPPGALLMIEPQKPHPAHEHPDHESQRAAADEAWDLAVGGMHCASCVTRVEQALKRVPGISEARVIWRLKSARVVIDPALVNERAIAEAVSDAGYTAKRATDDPARAGRRCARIAPRKSNSGGAGLLSELD